MKNLFLMVAFVGLSFVSFAQSKTEIERIIQMSIDIDELQPYYRPEQENRKPLRIADNGVISSDLKLEKFGEPVQFMENEKFVFQ